MCGGASSTAAQQWGLPNGVGAVILAALVIITVVFGLDGILKALSKIGPVIIVMIFLVSVVTAMSGLPNYATNVAAVDAGMYIPDELPRYHGEIATPSRANCHTVTEGATLPI